MTTRLPLCQFTCNGLRACWRWLSNGSEYREGWYCSNCGDVHADGVQCPRLLIGRCDGYCGGKTRVLDRCGNCRTCGSVAITDRRLAQ